MQIEFVPIIISPDDIATQPPLPPIVERIIESHIQELVAQLVNATCTDLNKPNYIRAISYVQGQISVLKYYLEVSKWAASDKSGELPTQTSPQQIN